MRLSRRLIAESPGTTFAPSRDVSEPIHRLSPTSSSAPSPSRRGPRVSGHHRRDKMTGTAPVAIRNAMPEEGRCDRPGTGEVAFVVPERARLDPSETPDERKRSLHLRMIAQANRSMPLPSVTPKRTESSALHKLYTIRMPTSRRRTACRCRLRCARTRRNLWSRR